MRCVLAEALVDDVRQVAGLQEPRAQAVVIVVRQIGDAVGRAHDAPFERARQALAAMVHDAVLDFHREVQPLAALFEELDNAQALLVVHEMARELRHRRLARMAERRVADIMAERDGFREVFIEPQCARNRARNLRDLEAVRHARPIVVARDDVDLRLVLETAERLRVQDAVAVALELRAERALVHFVLPPRLPALRRLRREHLILELFRPLANSLFCHRVHLFCFSLSSTKD